MVVRHVRQGKLKINVSRFDWTLLIPRVNTSILNNCFLAQILQSKYSMTLHMRKHLSEPTSAEDSLMAFPCDQCMRSFHTKTALVAHERTHAMLVIIRCKLCEREFANRAQLAEHELTHTRAEYVEHEEREATMFECTVCSTLFSQQSHLNAHMSMQHNERAKKFMCAKCPKSYAIE